MKDFEVWKMFLVLGKVAQCWYIGSVECK